MLSVTIGIIFASNWTIKIPARTGLNGEPMAAPSFYWCISSPKKKWTFLVHNNNNLRMSSLLIEASISFRWYTLSKATLRMFWGWEVQRQKTKSIIVYISFKNWLKIWPEHLQSHLSWCNWMFHQGLSIYTTQ